MPAQCPASVNIEHEMAMVKSFWRVFSQAFFRQTIRLLQAARNESQGIDEPAGIDDAVRDNFAGRLRQSDYDRRAALPSSAKKLCEFHRGKHDANCRSCGDPQVARQGALASGVMPPRGRQVLSPANKVFSGFREVAVGDRTSIHHHSQFRMCPVADSDTHAKLGRFGGSSEAVL
jgi:hypothetical protein